MNAEIIGGKALEQEYHNKLITVANLRVACVNNKAK
jgi:hypothetical protein